MDLITDEMEEYLKEAQIPLRLACVAESGWPLVLSLWYVYQDGSLFCATQNDAKVVAYLRKEPRCAFEVASDLPPYCGIRGQALAHIDPDRGADLLVNLLKRYLGGTDSPLGAKLLSRHESEVAIELKPVRIFTWNFSRRMKNSIPEYVEKPCP